MIKVNFDLMRFEGGSFHQNFGGEGFLKMAKHFEGKKVLCDLISPFGWHQHLVFKVFSSLFNIYSENLKSDKYCCLVPIIDATNTGLRLLAILKSTLEVIG